MGWKQWTRERLTAAQLQSYLQDQAVMRFASSSARGAELPAPTEGMISTLDDLDVVERHDGAGWRPLASARAFGKMWRTLGFTGSAIPANTVTRIAMDAARVRGGFAFDNAADRLTVPLDGEYRVAARSYSAGGSGYTAIFAVYRVRASAADAVVLEQPMEKTSAGDYTLTFADVVPLKAGDALQLQATHSVAGGSYWGTGENRGVMVSAEWLGPLPAGTTPL